MLIKENSDFLYLFEANMTNCNGDPDQENKPRMDYETSTALVSDARRKRDIRDFLKQKGYQIFVDTLADKKVPMEKMFEKIISSYLENSQVLETLRNNNVALNSSWLLGDEKVNYLETYNKIKQDKKSKPAFTDFNNLLLTEIIKHNLIDIRLFGSAMAVEGVSRTFTGPVQINWGYSLHPVEMIKSNTITSIMNDDSSTFGKKHKLHYALIAHYGSINKYSAQKTGMTGDDRDIFRKALVQGMMNNQTDSKQGQTPCMYCEIVYSPSFDGYLGDLRRFINIDYDQNQAIRSIQDLNVDFSTLKAVISDMKDKGYIQKVIGWTHPFIKHEGMNKSLEFDELVDLWAPIPIVGA